MNQPLIPAAKPLIGDEERAAVDAVLRSGMVAQGPQVAAFEEEFAAALVAGRRCQAVSSGTAGLHVGLLACGIGPGDEVIVPSFTFAATANSVALTGAMPVFADIDAGTFGLSAESVAAAVTERTRAVMPVHLYGHPADMDGIGAVAAEHGLEVFEDAAQAHGASLDGRLVGTWGRFAMFSLYPTKNMTSGEGGMVACADEEVARQVRLLRNQGMERQYANEVVGLNVRMTDIHAAIGRVQLGKLPGWTAQRQANAAFFDAHLSGVVTPPVTAGAVHVYHQYTVRVDAGERDRMVTALREEHGIGTGVYYPTPSHRLASLEQYVPTVDMSQTERAAGEVISLPVHPSLSQGDLERVVAGVNAVVGAGA
ncbi:DegT/DnrJ/EryC1/StrS family aminotransferase [Georgenia satyanarayanai]|uniref:DegT/DnrJ/EryC1/StrS family aminotransferase n=1 Tax=Georgenia satyanarayanai TaxID=860221 RepID=UPI00203AA736|nr:DegT/DnrJ/EryC1/StrS family aminotransferase [Georgenia satyanarayanai]MCM3661099.1 DegT/DnrJ/EryC1/StrS family aminotransferase [Georgenia satyanarayanai]